MAMSAGYGSDFSFQLFAGNGDISFKWKNLEGWNPPPPKMKKWGNHHIN